MENYKIEMKKTKSLETNLNINKSNKVPLKNRDRKFKNLNKILNGKKLSSKVKRLNLVKSTKQ